MCRNRDAYTPKMIAFVLGSLRNDWWSMRNHRSLGWMSGLISGALAMWSAAM